MPADRNRSSPARTIAGRFSVTTPAFSSDSSSAGISTDTAKGSFSRHESCTLPEGRRNASVASSGGGTYTARSNAEASNAPSSTENRQVDSPRRRSSGGSEAAPVTAGRGKFRSRPCSGVTTTAALSGTVPGGGGGGGGGAKVDCSGPPVAASAPRKNEIRVVTSAPSSSTLPLPAYTSFW